MLATYINDEALSNYPFADGSVLPFPRSVIRDMRMLLKDDHETGLVSREAVYLTRISITGKTVSVTLSNGVRGTVEGDYAYGTLYNQANERCGWMCTGAIPDGVSTAEAVNIRVDNRCLAVLHGTESSPNTCIVTVNGIKYHIKDTLSVSTASGMSTHTADPDPVDIARGYEVRSMRLNVEDLGYPAEYGKMRLVTAIAADNGTARLDDHTNNYDKVTLCIEAVEPLRLTYAGNGHVLVYGRGSECENYLERIEE